MKKATPDNKKTAKALAWSRMQRTLGEILRNKNAVEITDFTKRLPGLLKP